MYNVYFQPNLIFNYLTCLNVEYFTFWSELVTGQLNYNWKLGDYPQQTLVSPIGYVTQSLVHKKLKEKLQETNLKKKNKDSLGRRRSQLLYQPSF